MTFFIRSARGRKRSTKPLPAARGSDKRLKSRGDLDENIPSDLEDSDHETKTALREDGAAGDDYIQETADEKKLRMAKAYLSKLEENEDDEVVERKLQEEVLEKSGRLRLDISPELVDPPSDTDVEKFPRRHKLAITSMAVGTDCVYTGSKDGCLIQWDAATASVRACVLRGKKNADRCHWSPVLALALSSDGEVLVSGCVGKLIIVWEARTLTYVRTFRGHRGPVTGLAFRWNSRQMFSCSSDRSVKVWNLDEMMYIETLFGHTEAILGIDSLTRERAATCGGRDRSVRIWKIMEESQLVFEMPTKSNVDSVECMKFINDETFITGADNGSLSLWSVKRKKPTFTLRLAHGGTTEMPFHRPITALAVIVNADVAASGSTENDIRLWAISADRLRLLYAVTVPGVVNCLAFGGSYLFAATGRDQRLGRWAVNKDSKNCVYRVTLPRKQSSGVSDGDKSTSG